MYLNKDYIIPSLAGRMGNQMFMVAHAYAKALEYNKQLVISKDQTFVEDDYTKHIFRKIETIDTFDNNHNLNPIVPSDDKHTQYTGYYQSEQHFIKYSEAIRMLFAPPYEFIERIKNELPKLFDTEVTLVSIRRGDYLNYPSFHPTLSVEYIQTAISLVKSHFYFVASDDIPWCRQNLNLDPCVYLERYTPYEQMWIMSMCHHFIISNSSFSWWGAWLSRFENKIVVAPSIWVGPACTTGWDNIHAKGWTILESRFENGLIYPK
jgi:hypothetical protein